MVSVFKKDASETIQQQQIILTDLFADENWLLMMVKYVIYCDLSC